MPITSELISQNIDTSELRIGNYVRPKTSNSQLPVGKVTNIYASGFYVDISNFGIWYEPIPITTEVLEKCGFAVTVKDVEWTLHDHSFYVLTNHEKTSYRWNMFRFKYLHQLQNIYYALTGEEIKYNPQH